MRVHPIDAQMTHRKTSERRPVGALNGTKKLHLGIAVGEEHVKGVVGALQRHDTSALHHGRRKSGLAHQLVHKGALQAKHASTQGSTSCSSGRTTETGWLLMRRYDAKVGQKHTHTHTHRYVCMV